MTSRQIPETDSTGTIDTNHLLAVFAPGQDAPFSQRILDILNAGPTGPAGADGDTGWAPIIGVVADGDRRVLRLVSWTGGTGTSPLIPTDNYIGSTGLGNIQAATDIRGAAGADGTGGGGGSDSDDGVLESLSLSFDGFDANGEPTAILTAGLTEGSDISVDLSNLYQRSDGITIRGDGVSDNPFSVNVPAIRQRFEALIGDARLDASAIKNLPANGNDGAAGADGASIRLLYGRFSTAPTAAPTGGSFAADNTFTTPADWHTSVPTGTDLLYAVVATITPPLPSTPTYSLPFRIEGSVGPAGAQGDTGEAGNDGWSAFIIFQRAASAPASLTGGSFTNADGLTPPAGWFHEPPAGTDALYSVTVSVSPAGVIAYDEPVPAGQDGQPGQHGRGAAIIFTRAASRPTTPVVTYSSGAINLPTGWSLDLDSLTGNDPIWQSYVNISPDNSVVVSTPLPPGTQGAQGPAGNDGTDGVDGNSVFLLYQRASSTPAASGGSYDSNAHALTPPAGWTSGIPSGTDTLWILLVSVNRNGGISYGPPIRFDDADGVITGLTLTFPVRDGERYATLTATRSIGADIVLDVDGLYQRSDQQSITGTGADSDTFEVNIGWITSQLESLTGNDRLDASAIRNLPSGGGGSAGTDGNSVFAIYQRSSTSLSTPTGGSYDTSTNVFTPPTGWSQSIPAGTEALYLVFASVTGAGVITYHAPISFTVRPSATEIRDDLQTLTGGDRLSASAIQGLPETGITDTTSTARLASLETLTADLHEFGNRDIRAATVADGVGIEVVPAGTDPTDVTSYAVALAARVQTTGVIWLRRTDNTIPLRNFRIRITNELDTETYEIIEGSSFDSTSRFGSNTYYYTRQGNTQYEPTVNISAGHWVRLDRYTTDRHTYYDGTVAIPDANAATPVLQEGEIRWGNDFGLERYDGATWQRTAGRISRLEQHFINGRASNVIPVDGHVLTHGTQITPSTIPNQPTLTAPSRQDIAFNVPGIYNVEAYVPVHNEGARVASLRIEMLGYSDPDSISGEPNVVLARGATCLIPAFTTGVVSLRSDVPMPVTVARFVLYDNVGVSPIEIPTGGALRFHLSETYSGNAYADATLESSQPVLPVFSQAYDRPAQAAGVIGSQTLTLYRRSATEPDAPLREYTAPAQAYVDVLDTNDDPALRLFLSRDRAIGTAGNAWTIRYRDLAAPQGIWNLGRQGTEIRLTLNPNGWTATTFAASLNTHNAGLADGEQEIYPEVLIANTTLVFPEREPNAGIADAFDNFANGVAGNPSSYTGATAHTLTYRGANGFSETTGDWVDSDPDPDSDDTLWVASTLAKEHADLSWTYPEWTVYASGGGTFYTQYSPNVNGPWGDFNADSNWVRRREPAGGWEVPHQLRTRRSEWRGIGPRMDFQYTGQSTNNGGLGSFTGITNHQLGEIINRNDYTAFGFEIFAFRSNTFGGTPVTYWVQFPAWFIRAHAAPHTGNLSSSQNWHLNTTLLVQAGWRINSASYFYRSFRERDQRETAVASDLRVFEVNFVGSESPFDENLFNGLAIINIHTRGSFRMQFYGLPDAQLAP